MQENQLKLNFQRDDRGLIKDYNYNFSEDGSVNWRAMVKDEFLFPNKSWFELRKKPMPKSIDGLEDHQLLIKLGGIKELAKLRGFKSVKYDFIKCEDFHVSVLCSIEFLPNYETNFESVLFQDAANATLNNTSSFATKFLETIACNRAFVRCVRNFLNIHIVGDDEIDKSGLSSPSLSNPSSSLTPQGFVKSSAEAFGLSSFENFIDQLRQWHKDGSYIINLQEFDPSSWTSYDDIPPKIAREIIKLLKK